MRNIITKKIFITLFLTVVLSCSKNKTDTIILTALIRGSQSSIEYKINSEIAQAFSERYPNIKIELKTISASEEDYYQKLQSTTTLPDIFMISPYSISLPITEKGLAIDLRTYINEKIKTEYDANIFSPQDTELYVLSPSFILTHVMYANKKIMDELKLDFPKTQKELLSQASTIISNGYTPIALGNNDGIINSVLLSAMIGRFGGKEWISSAIVGEEISFSDTNFINAIDVIKTLTENRMFNKEVLQLSYLQGYQEFVQGKAVYMFDNSLKINPIMQDMGNASDYIEVHVYPELVNEIVKYSTSAIYSDGFAINSKISKERANAAFKFIMFSLGQEAVATRMKNGEIPTYKFDIKNYEIKPLTKKFFEMRDKLTTTYALESYMDREELNVLDNFVSSMMLGDKTAEQVAYDYEYFISKND